MQFVAPDQARVTDVGDPAIGHDKVLVASRAMVSVIRTSSCSRAATPSRSRIRSHPVMNGAVKWSRSGRPLRVWWLVIAWSMSAWTPGGRDHFGFNIDGAAAQLFKAKGEWPDRIAD